MENIDILDLEEIIKDYDPDGDPADRVRTAQALIQTAIGVLYKVAMDTKDRNSEAYVVDHLKILVGSGHGFLDGSMNLDDWIERLEGNPED